MSRSVLFNGAVLYRPGAATKIDASAFNSLALLGLGAVGLVGEADGGQPSIAKVFVSAADVRSYFTSGPLVEAANVAAAPSKDPRVPTGAQSFVCVKVNQSTQSSYQAMTGGNQSILFQSKDYGDLTNLLTLAIAAGPTTGRVLTIVSKASSKFRTETSPELGATAKFTIHYTGAASTATMTITSTTLSFTTAGGVDDMTLNFAQYKNLADLLARITSNPNYTVVTLIGNAQSFLPSNLDYVTAADVKGSTYSAYSRNFDVAGWVNQFSSLLTATRSTGSNNGATWPDTISATPLSGGARGTSSNTNWTAALATLGTVDVQQVVPCCSQDGSTFGLGDTYTFASVAAATDAHCAYYSSTVGKSEREAFIGGHLSATALIAQANALNSVHTCLSGQQPQVQFVADGSIGFGPEYLFAAMLAGMRAGAPLGEPLTWKYVNAISVAVADGSWDPNNDTDSANMIINGVIYARNVAGKGTRVERGLTTYIQTVNDAYTEESVVQSWKYISRVLRQSVEDQFTGTRGLLSNINLIIPTMKTAADRLRDQGVIADSLVNGSVVPGFRSATLTFQNDVISISAVVSPVEGINFILQTLFLVPATAATNG